MRIIRHPEIAFLLSFVAAGALGGTANGSQAPNAGHVAQLPAPAQAGSSSANGPSPIDSAARDMEILRDLEADYVRAEMEDNAGIAKSILADDYIGMKADGSTTSKSEVLNNLAAHARSHQPVSITAIDMREHLFGDVACVTYTKIYTLPTSHASFSENVLHIFTKRNGIWHLQVSTPTPAPHPSPPA